MRGREEDEDEVLEEGVFAQEGVSVYDEVRTRRRMEYKTSPRTCAKK